MTQRLYTIETLGGRNSKNRKTILKRMNQLNGFDLGTTINKYKKAYGVASADEMYELLRNEYNEDIENQRKHKIKIKKEKDKVKKEQEREKKNKLKSLVTRVPSLTLSSLRETLHKFKGQNIVLNYIVNGNFAVNKQYNIPTNFSSWWKKISLEWYDGELFALNGKIVIYPQSVDIKPKQIIQYFRDGINHCVFYPIRCWANELYEGAKSKQTKSRYNIILKNLTDLENKYKRGLPENAVSEVCNSLQIDMEICLPFCETKFIEAQSIKKRLKLFKFMNTRLNHIDLNEVVNNDSFTEVSRKELLNIKADLDEKNEFYTYKKDMTNISCISTLNTQYKLKNDFGEICSKFEIDNGLNFCKIDDIDDYELSQFIQEGTNYNGTIDFKDLNNINYDDVKHIDMKKAYANFKTCEFYQGFLGKITDFRQTNKIEGVGMYKITNIDFSQCNETFKLYNNKLNVYVDNNVYTSAELDMLSSYNVIYTIVCGCWGVKSIDFEFNKDMLESTDENGSKYYAKWTGMCDSHHLTKQFWIKGDEEYFQVIRNQCEGKIVRWYENGEGCIEFPKKHNYHLAHITAFITAYQRINVFQQLLELQYNNVVRVCVDGIYFIGEDVELKNVFRKKPDINFNNECGLTYCDKACEKDLIVNGSSYRDHYAKQLHLGEGGSGKTHYNCSDNGLVRPMFLAPSWKLARCKKNELEINCSVWARALADDPEKITAIKERANVLIIDEVSMLSENQKEKFFEVYGDMKIIMCGDLGYQLPCIEGEEMNTNGFDNIVKHTNDYRCNDVRLKTIKNNLRKMISNGQSKKEINDWVIEEFSKLSRIISVETLQKNYQINDMILSGTNELKDYYTSLFAGKFGENDKYYVMENNRLYCNGDIVIGKKPESCKNEIRHCFTTHSIQGETAKNNLFIDSSKMFDSRMFYTAISRAKTLDQVFIIINEKMTFKYEYAKIYKIFSKNGIYIGSTIHKLEKRLKEHIYAYQQYKNGKGKYMTSFPLLDDDDVKIEKIESFRCNDLKELWKREAEIIQQVNCVNKTFNENKN